MKRLVIILALAMLPALAAADGLITSTPRIDFSTKDIGNDCLTCADALHAEATRCIESIDKEHKARTATCDAYLSHAGAAGKGAEQRVLDRMLLTDTYGPPRIATEFVSFSLKTNGVELIRFNADGTVWVNPAYSPQELMREIGEAVSGLSGCATPSAGVISL